MRGGQRIHITLNVGHNLLTSETSLESCFNRGSMLADIECWLGSQVIANLMFTEAKGFPIVKIKKVAKISNRYNQVPHLPQDTIWESDKKTIKHHKQEPRGQPFPSR